MKVKIKTCNVCKVDKEESMFTKKRGNITIRCKKCTAAYSAINRGTESDNNEIVRRFILKNKLKAIKRSMPKTPYEKFLKKEKVFKYHNNYQRKKGLKEHKKPPIRLTEKQKNLILLKNKIAVKNKRELKSKLLREIREINKEEIRIKYNESVKLRRINDPIFSLKSIINSMVRRSLKDGRTFRSKELGYTAFDLFELIKTLPSRKNNLDHKIPIDWFNEYAHFSIVHNINNLQLLCSIENARKKNNYAHPVSKDYYNEVFCFIKPEKRALLVCNDIVINNNRYLL